MHPHRATFLLVHGAWYGSWIWRKLIPMLEGAGHQVLAPDLPGAGQDQTPLSAITFASLVNRILDLLDRAREPVILVGHGFSGMIISQVAEVRPEKIRQLTYLTALLPRNGEAALATQTVLTSQGHPLFTCVEMDDASIRLRFDAACPLWFHDCSPTDMLLAERLLRPQSLLPMYTPVELSQQFESIPRVYLLCSYDRVLTPLLQKGFYIATACERIVRLPSGHMPFLSIPGHLATQLDRLAQNSLAGAMEQPP